MFLSPPDEWRSIRPTGPRPHAVARRVVAGPYLVLYSDNYLDLFPGESKTIQAEVLLPEGVSGPVSGTSIVEGTNVPAQEVAINLDAGETTKP